MDILLLQTYTRIVEVIHNRDIRLFAINRMYKLLQKQYKRRTLADFPKEPLDLLVVNLSYYIKEQKYAYAMLYASTIKYRLEQLAIQQVPRVSKGLLTKIKESIWRKN